MPYSDTPRADLTAIKNWVALEEKIVHDYGKQKTAQLKSVILSPKTPPLDILKADLTAIKNRVALGKKVVMVKIVPRCHVRAVVPGYCCQSRVV